MKADVRVQALIEQLQKQGLNGSDLESAVTKRLKETHDKLFFCQVCGKTFRSVGVCERCGSSEVELLSPRLNEQQDETLKVVAKGITDKKAAEEVAQKQRGRVIEDEEDPKKFAVVIEESITDNTYTNDKVDVTMYGLPQPDNDEDDEVEHSKKTSVTFEVEFEYRSWGIKGFDVSIRKPLSIFTTLGDVNIPVNNIEISWVAGDAITPQEVEVDYRTKKATVIFSYPEK